MSIPLTGHETEIRRAVGDVQLVIGQNAQGHWILAEARKRYGGIFVSREAALKFAARELGIDSSAVRLSNELLALRS